MKYRSAPLLALLILTLTLNFDGHAQTETRSATVYRCGKDGRDLRDAPCPDKPRAPATQIAFDQPSDADAQAARERAGADARQANAMQRARLREESGQRRQTAHAGRLSPAPTPAPAASAPQPPLTAHKPRLHKPKKPPVTAG